jgi:PPOX class probable F420-dependent enzyme
MRVPDVDLSAARRMFAGLPTVAVATVDRDGSPHVVPLWFVWPEEAIYVSTSRDSRTWHNASADPRVSLSIDLGRSWVEIAGIEVRGRAELLSAEHPEMRQPISAWHEKYRPLLAGDGFARFAEAIAALAFLRIVPERVSGWDHARP